MTDRETLILVQEIAVAGNETTRNTLIGGMAMILGQPSLADVLCQDRSLIPGVVEELPRLFCPVSGMWRIAKEDTILGDIAIPKGAIVMVRMESANRDPAQFPDPLRIDPRRFNRASHLSFGLGIHYCVGNMLARRELTIAFTKILGRLKDIRIVKEPSDLGRVPNVLVRATKALQIEFEAYSN